MADDLHAEEMQRKALAPPGHWTITLLVIMSVMTLIFSGYMIYTYSGTRPDATTTKAPAKTGFTPVVDETRPAPGTTGQGGKRP